MSNLQSMTFLDLQIFLSIIPEFCNNIEFSYKNKLHNVIQFYFFITYLFLIHLKLNYKI